MTNKFLSDEDKALFREHMREVKPLDKKNTHSTQRVKTLPTKSSSKIKPRGIQAPHLSDFIQDAVCSATVLSYSSPSIPNNRFRALKTGQIPWEARLDLHGLTTEEARLNLYRFIDLQAQNQKRCLLIIHGKGGHQGAPPVIKNLVNRWLPQFEEVLAYHSALAKDGGTGALYVLLKKNLLR